MNSPGSFKNVSVNGELIKRRATDNINKYKSNKIKNKNKDYTRSSLDWRIQDRIRETIKLEYIITDRPSGRNLWNRRSTSIAMKRNTII